LHHLASSINLLQALLFDAGRGHKRQMAEAALILHQSVSKSLKARLVGHRSNLHAAKDSEAYTQQPFLNSIHQSFPIIIIMNMAPATTAKRILASSSASQALFSAKRHFASSVSRSAAHSISRCGVVGAGQMGLGIAYVAAKVRKTGSALAD
jgi:hypothetical protein